MPLPLPSLLAWLPSRSMFLAGPCLQPAFAGGAAGHLPTTELPEYALAVTASAEERGTARARENGSGTGTAVQAASSRLPGGAISVALSSGTAAPAAEALSRRIPAWMVTTGQARREPGALYYGLKRLADIAVALGVLLLLFPVLLAVAVAIYLEDRGPILYHQTRVGRNGTHFRFYKFRSMVRNADALKEQLAAQNESTGPAFKMRNDPRITRVGRILRRYSIDELPQLFSVLGGQMSLVGPRPHLPREVAQYTDRQQERLAVQPGLLCLREVLGRSNVSFEQWVEWDLLYVQNRSLRTDIWILLRTIPAVLKAEGAY